MSDRFEKQRLRSIVNVCRVGKIGRGRDAGDPGDRARLPFLDAGNLAIG